MTLSEEEFKEKRSKYMNYFVEANLSYKEGDLGTSFEQYTCGLELLEELIECDPKPEYKMHKNIIEQQLDELAPKIDISEGDLTTMSRYLACLYLGLANKTSGKVKDALSNFSRALDLVGQLEKEDPDTDYTVHKDGLIDLCDDLSMTKAFEEIDIKERDGVLYLSQKPK